jgi:hypothetical protein
VLGRRKASGGGGRRLLKAVVAAGCVVGVRFRAMPRGGRWGWGGATAAQRWCMRAVAWQGMKMGADQWGSCYSAGGARSRVFKPIQFDSNYFKLI